MIPISGSLKIIEVTEIADHYKPVSVSDAVTKKIAHTYQVSIDMSSRIPTYGRTTGVGANKDIIAETNPEHGLRLLRSHSVDAGPYLPEREVRAMLAVRLNQLCIPGAGIKPDILSGLTTMLNENALPKVKRFGAIGTADLTALAGTALTLMGERVATRPLTPMPPWPTASALPFMSSSALTIGQACLLSTELRKLLATAEINFIAGFTSLRGEPQAFSNAAATAIAAPEISAVTTRLRTLLPPNPDLPPKRIQDPYGLRVFPIVQANLIAALNRLDKQLQALIQAAQENPLFDEATNSVIHHAAFFQSTLGLDVDGVCLALMRVATLSHARIRLMNEPNQTGRQPFLSSGPSGSSGLMMVEYVAASALAEIRASANPASNNTLSLSRGAEEDAPFASQAVLQLQRALAALRIVQSAELLGVLRLLRQLGTSSELCNRVLTFCTNIPTDDTDRDLREDLEQADKLLEQISTLNA